MFVMLDDFRQPRTATRATPTSIAAKLRASCAARRSPTRSVTVFGAPPVDGLGTAGGFKLMIEDRGDVGLAALQTATDELVAAGQRSDPRLRRPVHQLPRQHAVALPRHRPHQVRIAGRADGTTSSTRCRSTWAALRQRLQPVRPHLAGERPGRADVPHAGRDIVKQLQGPQQARADGAAGHAGRRRRRQRPGDGHALQHVLRRPRSTATRRPASAPGEAIADHRRTLADELGVDATSGPS